MAQCMVRVLLLRDVAATTGRVLRCAGSGGVCYQVFFNHYSSVARNRTAISRSRVGTVWVGSRQLSSSNVLRDVEQDQSDSELLKETPTFTGWESELASSADTVAASSTTTADLVTVQTENFAELGLGGYSPAGLVQSSLEFIHNNAHLPWWASIAIATVALRVMLFPLAVRMQVNAAKIANVNPYAQKIHKRMMAYRNIGNKVAEAQEASKLMTIYKQHGVNPVKTLFVMPFLQVPIFISFFAAIRGMAGVPVESMKTGGIYWFTDLTVPDPTYVLPLLACLTFISNIELGGEGGAPSSNTTHRNLKMFMRASAVMVLPISITFPSGLFVYWVTNSLFSTCQILFLKVPQVKAVFGIPKIERPSKE